MFAPSLFFSSYTAPTNKRMKHSIHPLAVPRLMGVLMDPSRSKSNGGNDSERKFVIQILWLSLAGGTASFTRVSSTLNGLHRNSRCVSP